MCLPQCCILWLVRLQKISPLFTEQTVSVFNNVKNLWLVDTVICEASNGSYLVQIIGGGQYQHAHDHIKECHPDAISPDALAPTTFTPLPTSPATTSITPVTPEAWHQMHLQPHHALHRNHYLQIVHQYTYGHNPLECPQAQLVLSKPSHINLPKLGSHTPCLSWKYRPTPSPTDGPNVAMTWTASTTTNEVLFHRSQLWKYDRIAPHRHIPHLLLLIVVLNFKYVTFKI